MELKITQEDADLIADAVVKKILMGREPEPKTNPFDELRNWISQKDLLEVLPFGRGTLYNWYNKGLIGKVYTGGATFYYLPDILNLLESMHFKKEAVHQISDELRVKKSINHED